MARVYWLGAVGAWNTWWEGHTVEMQGIKRFLEYFDPLYFYIEKKRKRESSYGEGRTAERKRSIDFAT